MNIQYIVTEDDRTAISRVHEESWKYIMHGEIKKLACASLSTPCGARKGDLKNSLFEPVV